MLAIQFSLSVLLVLVIPGCILAVYLPPRSPQSMTGWAGVLANLADAIAFSVALSTLAGQWLLVAGIRLNAFGLAAVYSGVGVLLLLGLARRGRVWFPREWGRVVDWVKAGLVVLLPLAALLAWRFYQARDLALPAWVDSVHHVLIVRKMMEYGGVPPDLQPYLYVPFYYHYGFHLTAALVSAIAQVPAAQGVLWFGQVINAAVALSVFRLGTALVDRKLAAEVLPAAEDLPAAAPPTYTSEYSIGVRRAAVAALLVGFVLQMPAYYLTWGRYTLLTGLVLMGPVMAEAYQLWKGPADWRTGMRFAILLAGIFFTHYLAAVLVGFFLLVLGGTSLVRALLHRNWRSLPWLLAGFTLLGILLALPWLWRVMQYNLVLANVQMVLPSEGAASQTTSPDYINYLVYLLGPRYNHILMGLSAAGLLLALRRADLRPLAAWAALLMVFSQPWGLRLGPFRPDLFIIVLFFPASLFLAEGVVSVSRWAGRFTFAWAERGSLALMTVLLLALGLWQTRSVINPATILARASDVAALDWINQHVPADARFFINSTPWQSSAHRGIDGGFWIMPYTGRSSLVPPAAYGYGSRESILTIADWAERGEKLTGCTPDFWALVRDARLTHVYVREGAGSLTPEALNQCAQLRRLYSNEGVFIYEILSSE